MKRLFIYSTAWGRTLLDNCTKIFCCFAVLAIFFNLIGCSRDEGPSTSTPPHGETAQLYALTYSAGPNGSIEGDATQKVQAGGDGSPVTAVPAAHYHFTGWSDGVSTAARTDRKVSGDIAVQAAFDIDRYTLSYTAAEHGTIEGANPQTAMYGGDGSPVTAVPAAHYHFTGWSDGVSTAARTDRKVSGDITVQAVFAIDRYTLNYTAAEHGTIEGASPQTVTYGDDGSPVTAVPAAHYHFTDWSDGVSTAARTDRKVSGDISVRAAFAVDRRTLTYTAAANGSISGANPQSVAYGGDGSPVKAVPADGYHFAGWSDKVASSERTDQNVTADETLTALFAVNRYTLDYSAAGHGAIEGVKMQTVEHGLDGSPVKAVPAKGYHFVSWSDGVTAAQRTDTKITANLKVSATFAVDTFTVGGRVSGLLEGASVVLQNKGGDDLTVKENGEFTFSAPLLKANTYGVRVKSQPAAPNQVCSVTGGNGTISEQNVKDVLVRCVPVAYVIGGTVSGLPDGNSLVLQNNGTDDLTVSVDGPFVFGTSLNDHSRYEVSVRSGLEKPNWACKVQNGAGMLQGKDVSDVLVDCYPQAVLRARAGIGKIDLNWNSQDFKDVTFALCLAQEKIPEGGFDNCEKLKGGTLEKTVKSPFEAAPLTKDIQYWLQLQVTGASGWRSYSEVVTVTPFGGLNDTGIDWCANFTDNLEMQGTRGQKAESCNIAKGDFPGQDAFYGRDADYGKGNLKKTGSGANGFDFTKVCMSGEVAGEGECPPNPRLGDSADSWACVRDNVTGLLWEVKSTSGLHSEGNTYSWYNPDNSVNGENAGVQNGGQCNGSGCDTQAFIQAVNETGLCGVKDWRLPTRKELLSIVDNGRFNPAIDIRYFPNTPAEYFWTSSSFTENGAAAWEVYFKYGEAETGEKIKSNRVRLVRGRTVTFGLKNP